jgi:hypothetical protein
VSAFHVATTFRTDCSIAAAFGDVGSMQTVTFNVPPVPL